MGGGLAFLNKKTWHPGSFRNQEEVWKREQQAAAEQRKVEELQKQMQEERKQDEFHQLAAEHGKVQKSERLDWMYSGGLAAKEDAAKRAEEHLLGKPAVLQAQQEDASRCEQAANLSAMASTVVPATVNESWRRLHNDPLFAIKRQQQEQLQKIRENPVKMQEIIRAVVAAKEKKKEKKAKKEEKRAKKESAEKHNAVPLPPPPPVRPQSYNTHHQTNHQHNQQQQLGSQLGILSEGGRRRHDSPTPSPSASPSPQPRHHIQSHDRHRHPDHQAIRDQHHHQQQPPRRGDREQSPRPSHSRPADHSDPPRHYARSFRDEQRHEERDLQPERDEPRRGSGNSARDRKQHDRAKNDLRVHSSRHDRDAHADGAGQHSTSDGDRQEGSRQAIRNRTSDRPDGPTERQQYGSSGTDGRKEGGHSSRREGKQDMAGAGDDDGDRRCKRQNRRNEQDGHRDDRDADGHRRSPRDDTGAGDVDGGARGASKGASTAGLQIPSGYGLARSRAAPSFVHSHDANAAAAATRARLSEGAKAREEEAKAKAALAQSSRKEYKTGRMTEEEKASRLAEMMGNSEAHEAGRIERMKRARDAEGGPDMLVKSTGSGPRNNDAFMQAATRDVYSAMAAGGTTIESRVSSRKHFNMK